MTEKSAKQKLASVLCCFAGAVEQVLQGMQGILPTQMTPHLSSRSMTLIFSCECPKDSYSCECPKDSYEPLPISTPKGLSYGPLRPETSPHLLLGAWWGHAGLLGGRFDSKAVLSLSVTQLKGIRFFFEKRIMKKSCQRARWKWTHPLSS